MIDSLKDFIKTRPPLYDALNRFRPIKSDLEKWLDRFSKRGGKTVCFIQIGASDGLRWDPIRRFVIRDKWNGVFCEPLPQVYALLKKNYGHIKKQQLKFVNAAVSSKDKQFIEIWCCADHFLESLSIEEKLFYLRMSSLDRRKLISNLGRVHGIESKIQSISVPVISVNSLVKKYWNHCEIDLLFIDAEGHDDKIIMGVDFEKIRPKAIVFESHNLGSRREAIHEFLSKKGYHISDFEGDSVAVL